MKSCLLIILIILLCPIAFRGQNNQLTSECKLTIKDSPILLGLKLGMTPKQVEEALGRKAVPRDVRTEILVTKTKKNGEVTKEERWTHEPIGETEFTFYPRDESNVGSLFLRFWKDRLYTFSLNRDLRDFKWQVAIPDPTVIAETLLLPPGPWEGPRLTCSEFYIDARRNSDGVRIEITDSLAKNAIKANAEKVIAEEANHLYTNDPPKTESDGPPKLKSRKTNR